ncbi:hypothetical protein OUZ56_026065 [Daphnia magna]|uniref:Uncharacterized protein n=1 Tax=Daphnia magna TaxID=35525 RepID=A0ABQ9ZLI3_9CRUS|nr:hypothetical protein OUZ56_026065 [Daphnia magna]
MFFLLLVARRETSLISDLDDGIAADIADNSYVWQRTHANRLKPLYEMMLWKREPCPPFESLSDFESRFRKSIASYTTDFPENDIAIEDHDHEATIMNDTSNIDTALEQPQQRNDDSNAHQQQPAVQDWVQPQ